MIESSATPGCHRSNKASEAPAIALLTSPGIVLLHNGQEFGADYSLQSKGPDRVQLLSGKAAVAIGMVERNGKKLGERKEG